MGNDREVENSDSRRGSRRQALPLAPVQKSTHFDWAHTKVNRLVSGRKTAFVPELIHVQIRYLCLGTGWVGRDRSNFICRTFTDCYKSVKNLM